MKEKKELYGKRKRKRNKGLRDRGRKGDSLRGREVKKRERERIRAKWPKIKSCKPFQINLDLDTKFLFSFFEKRKKFFLFKLSAEKHTM